MCGLTGLFDMRARRAVERDLIEKMTKRLLHRGPDGTGYHFAPGVGLGHTRLAVIDIEGGAQPFFNDKNTACVLFNGEIYNFKELRRELEGLGYHFRTNSDTEVIIQAWSAWQEASLERLEGMFSFAIWDAIRETLFLARDRIGEKPLYYSFLPDGWLLFASELKALREHPLCPDRMDKNAVADFFCYGYIPDPKTIFKGVHKLEPGHCLLSKRGAEPLLQRYWHLKISEENRASPDDLARELRERLAAAIERQLVADVPLGAFLSGGLDSSAIVAGISALGRHDLAAYSISFSERRYDEAAYASLVARHCNSPHKIKKVTPLPGDYLKRIIDVFDEPFADSSALPSFILSAFAREGITVALSGDGGDELFAGYRRYLWHCREEATRRLLPSPLRKPAFGALAALYPKADWAPRFLRAKNTFQELSLGSLEGYLSNLALCSEAERSLLFSEDYHRENQDYHPLEVIKRHAEDCNSDHPLLRAQYIDLKTYLPGDILVKVDRTAMANSLEVRIPLLDREFLEWACSLPASLKLHGHRSKWIFKEALYYQLPPEILARAKKGFSIPLAEWLRGPLRPELEKALEEESLWDCEFFDRDGVKELFQRHMQGRGNHASPLWCLLVFSTFLAKEGGSWK